MPKLPDIQLPTHLKDRLAQGHPWVYRTHVPPSVRLPSGAWVRARCGSWSAYALWDAERPIALRIFSERQPPDARWVRERAQAAWDLRAPLRDPSTGSGQGAGCTAYRWLFGEGDGLPGLTADLYGDFVVIQTYMDGAAQLVDWLTDALRAIAPLRGIVLKGRVVEDRSTADEEESVVDSPLSVEKGRPQRTTNDGLRTIWGIPPPKNLVVREHGIQFYTDLQGGQKTGLFLDHRENRRFVEGLSAGRTVLNCFAYTGAFSLYALRGGARAVVSADIGKGLAEAAAANVALNGFDAQRHSFITDDCFELLSRYVNDERRFDVVVLDPPSFAKSKQSRYAAIRAYTRLNALAMRCLTPGGLLASASCTSQVGPEAFKEMLAAAGASADKRFQIIHEAGQPIDHPVPAAFPEGRYLKFVVGRVSDIA